MSHTRFTSTESLDDVDGITPQSLYEAYQKAVSEDQARHLRRWGCG